MEKTTKPQRKFAVPLAPVVIIVIIVIILLFISSLALEVPNNSTLLAILLFLFSVIASIILKPLIFLFLDMKAVADLNVRILEKKNWDFSSFLEIQYLQRTLFRIVTNINDLKSLIPENALRDKEDDEPEVEEPAEEENPEHAEVSSEVSASFLDKSKSERSSSSMGTKSSRTGIAKKSQMKKNGAVLMVNINGFNAIYETIDEKDVSVLLEKYQEHVAQIVAFNKGVVGFVEGDHIIASWNIEKRLKGDNASLRACISAGEILKGLPKLNEKLNEMKIPGIECRMGISSGQVYAGLLGAKDRKTFQMIGPVITQAYKLGEMNKLLKTDILITEQVRYDIKQFIPQKFYVKTADYANFSGGGVGGKDLAVTDSMFVYLLVPANNSTTEAWMLADVNREREEFDEKYEQAFDAFVEGKYEQSLELVDYLLQHAPSDNLTLALLNKINIYSTLKETKLMEHKGEIRNYVNVVR